MQFSVFTVCTLAAFAMASPHGMARRQTQDKVAVNVAAMTDKQGDIVPFNTKGVNQPAKAKGQ